MSAARENGDLCATNGTDIELACMAGDFRHREARKISVRNNQWIFHRFDYGAKC